MCLNESVEKAYPALADNEECVSDRALADNIVSLLVHRLLHHVGNLDQYLLGQVDKGGHGLEEGRVLGLPLHRRPHHDGLEALALDGPQLAVRRS